MPALKGAARAVTHGVPAAARPSRKNPNKHYFYAIEKLPPTRGEYVPVTTARSPMDAGRSPGLRCAGRLCNLTRWTGTVPGNHGNETLRSLTKLVNYGVWHSQGFSLRAVLLLFDDPNVAYLMSQAHTANWQQQILQIIYSCQNTPGHKPNICPN